MSPHEVNGVRILLTCDVAWRASRRGSETRKAGQKGKKLEQMAKTRSSTAKAYTTAYEMHDTIQLRGGNDRLTFELIATK